VLLKEFLKEHGKVEQLEKQTETLTAGLPNSERAAGSEEACFADGRQPVS
jgi:hypothetical protein